ncbi:hypothetical protein AM596_16190 [Clostridium perfringens CP4]|uniref:hypothetical protein n=2 Tax=Clostridium perfringens TaxID=1502 RepID=UPI000707E64A|nr:hypothetical protein [Clostridium perfringens]KQC91155.1 hypothetical protein AM596_16190 [Clostridium perfringens CP4]
MGLIIRPPQVDLGGGVNVGIDKGRFLATENQNTFVIQNTISTNNLLMIHVNNLYLEKDINYSISEDSISGTTTITLPNLKLNDAISWILIKVGDTPIKPEVKQAICGTFKCGTMVCGQGLGANTVNELDDIFISKSSLSEEFLKQFG